MLKPHRVGETFLLGADPHQLVGYGDVPSLLTIGPPGSGKTTAALIYNCLTYEGSMIILDVKGEICEATRGYKQAQGFRVLRYAPYESLDQSHGYDPLKHISTDKNDVWDECGQLARYLLPDNPGERDPFWSLRARSLLQMMICASVLSTDPEDQTFASILTCLAASGPPRAAILADIGKMGLELDILPMARTAASFEGLNDGEAKQLNSFYQVALSRLALFDNPKIEKSTSQPDWSPQEFRDHPTVIFLVVPPSKIKALAPLLRVILAQHLDVLRQGPPEQGGLPYSLIIDEAPQLGNFEPLVEAIETMRGYGTRLWICAQTLDQLRSAYKDGDSLIAMCAVRCFMNVQAQDALLLSMELGDRRDVLTGKTKRLATQQQLMGPEFAEKVIVMANKMNPVMLDKLYIFDMPAEIQDAIATPYVFTRDGFPPIEEMTAAAG